MEPLLNKDEEIVNIPVPKRFLSVVIQALARAMVAEESSHSFPPVRVTDRNDGKQLDDTTSKMVINGNDKAKDALGIDWTHEESARRLRRRLHLPIALKLLDITAERAGEMVPFSEIVAATDFETTQQAGSSLGAFTKIIKREFGVSRDEASWPVEHHWAAGGDLQYYYRMQPKVADAWRRSASRPESR